MIPAFPKKTKGLYSLALRWTLPMENKIEG